MQVTKYASDLYHRKMMNELHTQKSPKFYIVTITNIASFTIIIVIILIIIIIITRPKPAYGRQGLAGFVGQRYR